MKRDASLDTLLSLDGQLLVVHESGFWVKFEITQVPTADDKPHGLDYSLTLHAPDGSRLVGFDNAHKVKGAKGRVAKDHKHRLRTVKTYDYTDAAALLAAFWKDVDSVLRDQGV